MDEASSNHNSEHSFFGDEMDNIESDQNKNQINYSQNSSNIERVFDTVNKKIKYLIENGKDLSYSNSNSKISDQFQNKEQFLYSRYWCVKKKNSNDTDSSSAIMENNKINLKEEEKILYYNIDSEEENNINNKFNDDFDEEDMEEKTIEKKENDINEINSIKMNNNNLNNKDSLANSKSNSNIDIKPLNNINSINNTEKINMVNTPNKINQNQTQNNSFMPYIYNTNQVQSFISSYNNYPSNLSKGSFISTNNSSNNKYKKNEEYCPSEIEEDEIKQNNNTNLFTHGNKFGPHLMDFNHIQNSNINFEPNNLTNMTSINNYNMNSNFLYNRIPKMNLNMVYYIPIQQQTMPNNNGYINNNKIISSLNNGTNINDNSNNNINNLKSQNKESNIEIKNNNNNIINNIKNVKENINGNKDNPVKIKEKEKSSSKEKKNKNKNSGNNSSIPKIENGIISSTNNYKNNTNNANYKNNNNNYKSNDTHNSNTNTNSNINVNNNSNNQCNKGEKNLLNLDDIVSGKDTRTTVMIRNIPIKYTDTILINALEEFKGKYDCLYMPYDYEKKGNKGYAFINFVNPLHILYFHEKFCGKKWPLFESSKICELNSANFQGIYEIQKHSKNYKGYKKPLFYSEPNKSNVSGKENMIIPSKYLNKLKIRFPKMKYKENKAKKIINVDSFE